MLHISVLYKCQTQYIQIFVFCVGLSVWQSQKSCILLGDCLALLGKCYTVSLLFAEETGKAGGGSLGGSLEDLLDSGHKLSDVSEVRVLAGMQEESKSESTF